MPEILIFNNAKSDQINELTFLDWLLSNIPNSKYIKQNYKLPDSLINRTLIVSDIINGIQNSSLKTQKKEKCIQELILLPNEIRIINSIKEISVDFAIVSDANILFIEFHEKQHRIDSHKRLSNVYSLNGNTFIVPRYLQRLLRDIWRLKYLDNYKIVWFDWFSKNPNNILLTSNEREFALSGKFKISEVL